MYCIRPTKMTAKHHYYHYSHLTYPRIVTYHVLELYIVLCFVAVQPQLTSYLYPQPPTPQPHLTNTTYPLHIGIMYYIMFSFCHYINQPKLTITPLKYWNYVLCQIRPCLFFWSTFMTTHNQYFVNHVLESCMVLGLSKFVSDKIK